MNVVEDRKQRGIQDDTGKEATPVADSADKYERGGKTLETFTKTPETKPGPGFGTFGLRIERQCV